MKNLLVVLGLFWFSVALADDYSYQELLDSIDLDSPMWARETQGVIREIDLGKRSIIIGGYSYLVGPSYVEKPLQVSLHGTEAGAFELLEVGMKVEVLYIDFGYSRVAFLIEELSRDALVEH